MDYFSATGSALSPEEFNVVMTDLAETGNAMVTILRCTRLAQQANAAPTGTLTAAEKEDAEDGATLLDLSLPTERKGAVEELFGAWDPQKTGSIDLKALQGIDTLKVGPRDEKVLTGLAAMDANGDHLVTLEEMLAFFGAAKLDDAEFKAMTGEMLTSASTALNIASLVKMTEEAPVSRDLPADPDAEDDDDDTPPPLSGVRTELVKELFSKYSESQDVDIDISTLQADCTSEIGPNKEGILQSLSAMDADGDGKVTFKEMVGYFTVVGAALNEDEFQLVLDELIQNAQTAQLIRMVQ
jgi:Ca2+-binding EF-hand superfamily protein